MTAVIATPTLNANDEICFDNTEATIALPALTDAELEAGVTYNEDFLNGTKTNTKLARALTRFSAAAAEKDALKAAYDLAREAYQVEADDSGKDFDAAHFNAFRQVRRDIKAKMDAFENTKRAEEANIIAELKGNYRPMNPVAVAKLIEAQFTAGV